MTGSAPEAAPPDLAAPGGDPMARLSLNSQTCRRLDLDQIIEVAATAGLLSIGVWRRLFDTVGVEAAAARITDAGLTVSTLCRGGFLSARDPDERAAGLADNRRAIDEAATLGTRELVMVVGGLPAADRDLKAARGRVIDGIAELVPYALDAGVRLALEPLHPMYCADRAVLSTLGQALDWAAPYPAEAVGVTVDTFHIYWDPDVEASIARAGRVGRIASYQVCDFNLPIAPDALESRGMMGDGVINFAELTHAVAATGYGREVEVEIFNAEIWARDGADVVAEMQDRYATLVAPYL